MQFTLNALRYEDVRQQVVDFLKERGEYNAEFDYQGSNMAYVIDTMAYVSMLMSYMISQDANNRFLDTTEIRKNAVSIAKTLGYRPLRKKVARFIGTFVYQGVGFTPSSWVEIAPKSVFTAGGNQYVNLDPIICQPRDGSTTELKGDFTLLQGEFREMRIFGTGQAMQSVVLPSLNVSEDYLKVYIKNTVDGDDTKVEWTYAKTFFDSTQTDIFFVEEDRVNEGMPKIVFGNGVVGRIPSQTETIIIEWLETKGATANGDKAFNLPDASVFTANGVGSFDKGNFRTPFIPASSASYGGTDLESLESIKVNAPMYYAAAGRGVTANDYRTLGKEFTTIEFFNVIGGDELFPNDPTKLGNSYFTGVPKLTDPFLNNDKLYLTEQEENEVLSRAKDVGIIATKKFFTKPSYIFLDVTPYIELKQNISANDAITIKSAVVDNLESHFTTRYSAPGVPFRESKLNAAIDNTEGVISSYSTISYNMVLNFDSFYGTKENRVYFPNIAVREASGRIVPGEFTNFVKMNSQIVEESNGQHTIFDLPPELSSVYGSIEQLDGTQYQKVRHIYNNDAVDTEIFQIRELSNGTLSIVPKQFRSRSGDYVVPIMSPNGTAWNISFDNAPTEFVATVDFADNPPTIIEITDGLGHIAVLDTFGVVVVDGSYLKVERVTSNGLEYWSIRFVIASNVTNLKVHSQIPAFSFTSTSAITSQYILDTEVAVNPTVFPDDIQGKKAAIFSNTGSTFMWDVDATNDSTLPAVTNTQKVCRVVVPGTFPNSVIAEQGKDYRKGDWLFVEGGIWKKASVQGTLDASVDPMPEHVEHGEVYGVGPYEVFNANDQADPWKDVVDNAVQLSGLYDFPKQRVDWMHQLAITEALATDVGSVAEVVGFDIAVDDVIYYKGAPFNVWVKATVGAPVDPNGSGALPDPTLVSGEIRSCTDRGSFMNYPDAWFEGGVSPTVDLDDRIISLGGKWRYLDPTEMGNNLDTRFAQNLPIEYGFGHRFEISETGDFNGFFPDPIDEAESVIYTGVWSVFSVKNATKPTIPDGQVYLINRTGTLGSATTYYAGDHIVSFNSAWHKIEPYSVVLYETGLSEVNSDPSLDWVMAADKTFTYSVMIRDLYDGAVLGTLDYLSGECLFNQFVTGHPSMATTTTLETRYLFSLFTTATDYKMALFRLIPVDKTNGDPETDFDTGYNQVVKARINSVRNKSELQ